MHWLINITSWFDFIHVVIMEPCHHKVIMTSLLLHFWIHIWSTLIHDHMIKEQCWSITPWLASIATTSGDWAMITILLHDVIHPIIPCSHHEVIHYGAMHHEAILTLIHVSPWSSSDANIAPWDIISWWHHEAMHHGAVHHGMLQDVIMEHCQYRSMITSWNIMASVHDVNIDHSIITSWSIAP